MGKAKFTGVSGERVCRLDLNNMEIEVEGMEKEKCKKKQQEAKGLRVLLI